MMSTLLTTVYMLNSGWQGVFYYVIGNYSVMFLWHNKPFGQDRTTSVRNHVAGTTRHRWRIMRVGFVFALLECSVINVHYNRKRHENSWFDKLHKECQYMGKVDKVVHILSTWLICEKARKLKLYTKLSTLSTFYVCGILDLHKKKRNKCFV